MKLKDLLSQTTEAIEEARGFVYLEGGKTLPIERCDDRFVLRLPKLTVESVSPRERSLMGQVAKHVRVTILRVREERADRCDGSIAGEYFPDVELECTRRMFEPAR